MIPRTQIFSPSRFLIARGNARQECGKERSAHVRIRSNFKDHGIELLGFDTAVLEAPVDRQEREGGVVLAPRETFLLHGADGHAIDHECCRRIVVVC